MKSSKGVILYSKAKKIIPGGTQLLSKRPEMFLPNLWPSYYKRCKGIEVWDLDNKKYLDFSISGVGTCPLGYADHDVDNAVVEAIRAGNMCTLNVPEEIELAQLLCSLHPWAGMVRYTRSGGEAMAVAVRIARAYTGKDKILFCGYHGWHDWYLSSNLADDQALDGHLLPGLNPLGVPRPLKGLTHPFKFNDAIGFIKLISKYGNSVGAVILETIRNEKPNQNFIEAIRATTRKKGIVFIVDEITSGWRLNNGGAHLIFGIEPDMAVFAKAISNGYPMAAVIGKPDIMQAAQDTFISSTYWTDKIGPAAALATIKKMKKYNVPAHLIEAGEKVQNGWIMLAEKHDLKIHVSGIYPLSHFEFKYRNPLILKTLYTQYMLEKGFLASTVFYATYKHTKSHIQTYLLASDEAFDFIANSLKKGKPERYLKGPVCDAGFKRLN